MQDQSVEKTIYLNRTLVRRIEEIISNNPSLNFAIIINQALEDWFNLPKSTNLNRDCFITDAPKGYGPISKETNFLIHSSKYESQK